MLCRIGYEIREGEIRLPYEIHSGLERVNVQGSSDRGLVAEYQKPFGGIDHFSGWEAFLNAASWARPSFTNLTNR